MHTTYFETTFDRLINVSIVVIGAITLAYPMVTFFS